MTVTRASSLDDAPLARLLTINAGSPRAVLPLGKHGPSSRV
jgi:hypothetical protein